MKTWTETKLELLSQEASNEAIEEAKQEYRKMYLKHKRESYKSDSKRVEIRLSNEQWKRVQKEAQRHHQRVPSFVKTACLAYLEQSYAVPSESALSDLLVAINRVGSNINQIAYVANISKSVNAQTVDQLRQHFWDLESVVFGKLTNPINVTELVQRVILERPEQKPVLRKILDES